MCGIAGFIDHRGIDARKAEALGRKMAEAIIHRGPDDQGVWMDDSNGVVLAHRRLSIIDLSAMGHQPMGSANGRYVVVFNGEIYNYKEIKNELLNKNIRFKSNTDTEVILESYKYWGFKFLEKLRGMFSFVIWDMLKKKLIFVRDPFGIKPLYYFQKDGVTYFASQIKSLLSIEDLKFEFSNKAIVSYYMWGNIEEPITLYKNIKSIKKGTCLIIDKNNNEEIIDYANIKNLILNSE